MVENTDVSLSLRIHRASWGEGGGIDISGEVNNGLTGLNIYKTDFLWEPME